MNLVFKIMLLVTLCVFALAGGCSRNATEPEVQPPDFRTLQWLADTLLYPGAAFTNLFRMWGSSAKNIYAVGINDGSRGSVWHYDGSSWQPWELRLGGGSLFDIYGSSPENIYVVGTKDILNPTPPPNFLDSSRVLHYDGTQWVEVPIKRQRLLQSIGGMGKNAIWAAGVNGTLYRFDGNEWLWDSVPIDIPSDANPFYNFIAITGHPDHGVYMLLVARPPNIGEIYYLLHTRGGAWQALDSLFSAHLTNLWLSPSGRLLATGSRIYEWNGTTLATELPGQPDNFLSSAIYGESDNNMLVVGRNGVADSSKAFHFNGKDWHSIDRLTQPSLQYFHVWSDGREVFVLGNTLFQFPRKTIVMHGE